MAAHLDEVLLFSTVVTSVTVQSAYVFAQNPKADAQRCRIRIDNVKRRANTILVRLSPRISNQAGCFTTQEGSTTLEEILAEECFYTFHRIRVAANLKSDIVNELFALGFHQGFVYPGLDGLAGRLRFEVTAQHKRHADSDRESRNDQEISD